MWRSLERIMYVPNAAPWPTARQAATSRLFSSIDFLAIRLRAEPERCFAQFFAITDRPRDAFGRVGATDREIRAWLSARSQGELREILDPDEMEVADHGYRDRVTDVHVAHIRDLPRPLPELFSAAARRAYEAGFDGVECHHAHAHTMASFLSVTNERMDGYGGNWAAWARFPLEVYVSARVEVGHDHAVGCRFLADECVRGSSDIEDAIEFGCACARAGTDLLSLSRGGNFDDAAAPKLGRIAYPYTGRSGYERMPS